MQTLVENISQIFACILDPYTFPEKASPFYFYYLELLQGVSINDFDECVSTNVWQLEHIHRN